MSHDNHGHDSHGHGAHGEAGDIIPEGSIQDKILIALAGGVLVLMTFFGFQWSLSVGASPPCMPAEEGEAHHCPASE